MEGVVVLLQLTILGKIPNSYIRKPCIFHCYQEGPSPEIHIQSFLLLDDFSFWFTMLCTISYVFLQLIFFHQICSIFMFTYVSNFMAAVLLSPYSDATLYRNPKNKNAGNLVALSEFLALANNATSVSGVLIRIEVSLCCVT